ncbi:hypothetical protein ACFL6Y_05990 [Elusimicrobiota bacterium]
MMIDKTVNPFYRSITHRLLSIIFLSFIIHHSSFIILYAGGLSVLTGDIYVHGLQVGKKYNLTTFTGKPFRVQNNFNEYQTILIDPKQPDPSKILIPGYQALSDTSWIKINPREFELGPGQVGMTDIEVTVPKDKSLRGGKFEGYILSRNHPDKTSDGVGLVVGIKTRLLLNIDINTFTKEQNREMAELKKALNFMFLPKEITVERAKPGKWDIRKLADRTFKIVNPNDHELRFEIEIMDAQEVKIQKLGIKGLLCGDPEWVSLEGKDTEEIRKNDKGKYDLTTKGNSVFSFPIKLDIPKALKKKGKGVFFVFRATLLGYQVPVSNHSKLAIRFK